MADSTEKPVAAKRLGNDESTWLTVLTSTGRCFFFDSCKKISQWFPPRELIMGHGLKRPHEEEEVKPVKKIKTFDDKITEFKQLLEDMQISPFGLWAKDVVKLSKDLRFHDLGTKQKKSIYDNYCKEKIREAKSVAEKDNQRNLEMAIVKFKALLSEIVLSSNVLYQNILESLKLDPRFTDPNLTDTLKKSLFEEHISILEKKHNEEISSRPPEKAEEQDDLPRIEKPSAQSVSKKLQMLRQEACSNFKQLLEDKVRNHKDKWENVRRMLKNEQRYKDNKLSEDDKKRLYEEYIISKSEQKNDETEAES